MTQTHTVDFTTAEQARLVFSQIGGYAHRDGTMIEMDGSALESLRDLPADADGHYDGARIWIAAEVGNGRHSYRVDSERAECDGHESLDGAHMGEAVYCDGSCRA